MSKDSIFQRFIWVAGLIGASAGLVAAWTIRPTFLFTRITDDSMFRGVPAEAPATLQALSFAGTALIGVLHFTLWVGGSATLAAVATAYVISLLRDPRL